MKIAQRENLRLRPSIVVEWSLLGEVDHRTRPAAGRHGGGLFVGAEEMVGDVQVKGASLEVQHLPFGDYLPFVGEEVCPSGVETFVQL